MPFAAANGVLVTALLSLLLISVCSGEPARPTINHQTSTGTATFIDDDSNIQTNAFTTSIDPKEQLYYSTQGIGSTRLEVYMNASMVTVIDSNVCIFFHTREFGRPIDFYHKTTYAGELEITTPYFSNVTTHRFQGSVEDYDAPFDLYTKPGDADFIVRKVYYKTADFKGGIIDTREYTYEYHETAYFEPPANAECVDGAVGKKRVDPRAWLLLV
eukprot:TRINITY_DN4314_c0_g1_i1.p1 TRINITY_DN4314_c0_g1~~TRINITY_DN4314_c0_g1_i1.p1  ORF type:complete len:215 (+),score=70.42 TRINITY_DN4314_c0_g1_i1:111-755(+)